MTDVAVVWADAIERLRQKVGAVSYAHLARDLGLSPQKLADARKGRQELPSDIKAEILGLLDEPVSKELYKSIFPKRIRGEVTGHLDKIYDPEDERSVSNGFWIRRLDQLKAKLGDVPDSTIASNLGISQSMISATRSGSGVLSPAAKLKILDSFGYMASRDILCDLLPPRAAERLRRFENLRFVARGKRRKKIR